MIWWALANVIVTTALIVILTLAWWFFARAWRVLKIYSEGWTWCSVKTLSGTEVSGWVSIIHLRSIHSRIYSECPLFKIKTASEWVTVNPGEFETIQEVLGLWKVAWIGGNVGIK